MSVNYESQKIYLRTIAELGQTLEKVRNVDIAAALGYTKPSVSNMIQKLRSTGLVSSESTTCISLTETGKKEAELFSERMDILKDFLLYLGADEKSACENAVHIEHVISDDVFQLIKHYNPQK